MQPNHPDSTVRVVGETPDADFPTIQEAHDDLPGREDEEFRGSGLVVVDGSYDSSREQFPIRITRFLDVRGQSRTSSQIVCDDPETDVVRVEEPTDDHWAQNTPIKRIRLSNLSILGGRDGVVLDGVSYFSASFLTVLDTARDGITAVGDGGVYGSYLERCYVRDCGRTGFSLSPGSLPHGVVLLRSSATDNGAAGAHLSGFGANVLGGAYQGNGGPGIHVEGAGSMGSGAVGVHNTYLEYNGQRETHARDVVLGDGVRGAKLDNCYLTGTREFDEAESHAAIESRDNADCEVDHCTFRGYHWCEEAGLFDVADDSTNIELDLGSHHRFHGAEDVDTFLRRPATFYANGVRHGDDPTAVPGRYDGERAYAEGVSYVWSASHDEWLEG